MKNATGVVHRSFPPSSVFSLALESATVGHYSRSVAAASFLVHSGISHICTTVCLLLDGVEAVGSRPREEKY